MAADTPSDSSASANTNTTADSPAPRREVLGDLHPGQVVEPDERGAGGKARRHCSRACRAIHDLARTLRLYVGWMDCSEEVLIAAQRIIETYSDGGDLQIAASLLIATKLVSLQQRECGVVVDVCARRFRQHASWSSVTTSWHVVVRTRLNPKSTLN